MRNYVLINLNHRYQGKKASGGHTVYGFGIKQYQDVMYRGGKNISQTMNLSLKDWIF